MSKFLASPSRRQHYPLLSPPNCPSHSPSPCFLTTALFCSGVLSRTWSSLKSSLGLAKGSAERAGDQVRPCCLQPAAASAASAVIAASTCSELERTYLPAFHGWRLLHCRRCCCAICFPHSS